MNKFVQEKQESFTKSIDFFVKEIATLRVGRANPSLLDGIFVLAYGVKTPMNGLASISVTDARSMVISPWDKSVLKDIEKAIVEADLGLGVVNEGDKIRISLPIMTEENRKNLVKKLNEKMEEARIAVRKVRDEIKSAIEQAESGKEISEDEKYQFIRELEEEVLKKNEEIKRLKEKKEEDIMTI
ncbi:MAG: Ribosome-recycling factor Frr [Parcubacteria group bacterium GW2011_GWE2_38_18]|nr:MAG: Ribosome-recycling factor Frr [Parcubacteria group bacterium GW2011_GWE2_38_18]